jgi:uroporphyrinogen decarboxylase
MTPRERIAAAIQGERPDRVPIALWRHFPRDDETAEGLAHATVEFQRKFQFDLVKVTPASGYPAEAWGAQLRPADNEEGTREYVSRPVRSPEDWHNLEMLNPGANPVLSRELRALQLIRDGITPDVPILQTIFSPLTIAKQLAGDLVFEHLRGHPDDLEAGLRVITETTARFAQVCLKHGADGIFFATQLASYDLLSADEYQRFGVEFDLPVLESIQGRTGLIVLHLHGLNPMFELAGTYPVQVVNWHDRETKPTLAEGQRIFQRGAVLGGLHRSATLPKGSPEDTKREVRDAIEQTEGLRLIVGAGCVAPVTTPEENFRAAREAVKPSTDEGTD